MLFRVRMRSDTVDAIERALAQGEASEATLARTQALLAAEADEPIYLRAARGELAYQHHQYDTVLSGKANVFQMAKQEPQTNGVQAWFDRQVQEVLFFRLWPDVLKQSRLTVEAAQLPPPQLRGAVSKLNRDADMARNLAVLFTNTVQKVGSESYLRSLAQLRCAATAVACERYRLKHKAWPLSLDALVKEKLLDAVPEDPNDGKPLRLVVTKSGLLVYSVGGDETDNGGVLNRADLSADGADLGFELWDVPSRRQPPLPAKKV